MSLFDSPLLKPFYDMGAKAGAKVAAKMTQSINSKKTTSQSSIMVS